MFPLCWTDQSTQGAAVRVYQGDTEPDNDQATDNEGGDQGMNDEKNVRGYPGPFALGRCESAIHSLQEPA